MRNQETPEPELASSSAALFKPVTVHDVLTPKKNFRNTAFSPTAKARTAAKLAKQAASSMKLLKARVPLRIKRPAETRSQNGKEVKKLPKAKKASKPTQPQSQAVENRNS